MQRAAITILMTMLPGCALLASCSTGTVQTNNPTPPSVTWHLFHQSTGLTQNIVPANSLTNVFISPGDNYDVEFTAQENGGIKSISLSATGSVICSNNQGPYTQAHPFNYSIAATTATFPIMANNQVYTQAFLPYYFNWVSGPTMNAVPACGSNVPMFGTTTYNGKATNYGNVSTGTYSLKVTTCGSPTGCGG